MTKHILIVDDEPNVRMTYRVALETEGFITHEADSGIRALEIGLSRHLDVAILDMRMPEMDGLQLLEAMRDRDVRTPVIIITAYADVPNAVKAMKLGAIDFLQKPLTPGQLRAIVHDVLERHEIGGERIVKKDFDYFIRAVKRAINLRDFAMAKKNIIRALEIDEKSPEALNLAGVMIEMRDDYDRAKKYYGAAIKQDSNYAPAQQNMRRIYELFHFGSSKEPYNLGKADEAERGESV